MKKKVGKEAIPSNDERADSRRNAATIVATAQEVFARKGTAASIAEIARTAGLGVGTVYRHFPTKEALFEAIVGKRIENLNAEARRLEDASDPTAAFLDHFTRLAREGKGKKDLVDGLSKAGVDVKTAFATTLKDYWKSVANLLKRAQQSGGVRPDITVAEIQALLTSLVRDIDQTYTPDRLDPERLLRVVLDGLRPHP